jgi:hypothetical protein
MNNADQFSVFWQDFEREPQCPPDPNYPNGVDLKFPARHTLTCTVTLPYPAKRCGAYMVECKRCGSRVGITTAGRRDDPKSAQIPCQIFAPAQ